MKQNALKIAILCGGSGTRLFPLSRELMPKQFVPLISNKSLFQATIERNLGICAQFYIITSEAQYFLAKDEIEKIPKNSAKFSYILEAVAKNTAPSLLSIALQVRREDIILALPSDHIIKDLAQYESAIKQAESIARQGKIALFGIKPKSPNVGYGYIKRESILQSKDSRESSNSKRDSRESKITFFEKPDLKTAQKYLKEGGYFWNSGMFCFQAGTLINEFKTHQKMLFSQVQKACENATHEGDFTRLKIEDCKDFLDISIDYAIMEKSHNLALVEADFAWSDVGSFDALKDEFPKDSDNNAHSGEILAINARNNFVLANKLSAILGVENLIIVDTADCLMVAKSGESQAVCEVVKILKSQNSEIAKLHNLVHRPWGSYEVLLESAHYKLKQIIVKPKKRLSLQKHFHRNEHWIVVSGSALVQVDSREFVLNPNESTYIPSGSVHRLSNEGKIPLVIIEAQVGEYLGEDDIVRLEDDYRRA